MILTTAIDRHWRGDDLPTSQEISRQFYISPSQIRAVLKYAESLGLIRTAARGRLLDAGPLAEAYLDCAQPLSGRFRRTRLRAGAARHFPDARRTSEAICV